MIFNQLSLTSVAIRLGLLLLLASSPMLSQGLIVGQEAKPGRKGSKRGTEEITVTARDGKVVVRIDGKEAPGDRVSISADRIVVSDDDGKRMMELRLDGRSLDVTAKTREIKKERRIGVSLRDVDGVTASQLGIDSGKGMIVLSVQGDMPAQKAGIVPNDIIVAIDGKGSSLKLLKKRLKAMDDGEAMELKVLRRGKPMAFQVEPVLVTPKERRFGGRPPRIQFLDRNKPKAGVVLDDVTEELPILGDVFVDRGDGTLRLRRSGVTEVGEVVELPERKHEKELDALAKRLGKLQKKLDRIEEMQKKLDRIEKILKQLADR